MIGMRRNVRFFAEGWRLLLRCVGVDNKPLKRLRPRRRIFFPKFNGHLDVAAWFIDPTAIQDNSSPIT